jgi:hypothetical protein
MAKILLGAAFAQIRGSIGGTTFSQNANGAYSRTKSRPTNKNSAAQQAARALFGDVSKGWSLLTPEQRTTFIQNVGNYTYVDVLGQVKTYTGNQLYCALVGRLLQLGQAPISVCLPKVAMGGVGDASFTCIGGAMALSATLLLPDGSGDTSADVQAGTVVAVYATTAQSAGTSKPISSMRLLKVFTEGTPITSQSLNNEYTAAFGALPTVGNKVFYDIKVVSTITGQESPIFSGLVTIEP